MQTWMRLRKFDSSPNCWMWNRILVLLKTQMTYVSSDEESDGDKECREDTLYPYEFMEKRLLYHGSLFVVKIQLWDKDDPSNKYNSQLDCS